MAKTINFTYEGKDYTLEFTRRTIRQMEDEGFVVCLSIRNCIKRAPKSTVPGQHRFGFEKPRFCSV